MIRLLDYIFNTIIALLVLGSFQMLYTIGKEAYYTYMPIDTFYTTDAFTADNACVGDSFHLIHSKRTVKATEIGYGSEVIREMYLIQNGEEVKVFEEHAMPFMEVRADGLVTRQQPLPFVSAGDYQWIVYLTLYVHGVQRTDIPPIVSNVFSITNCI